MLRLATDFRRGLRY